jgi:hypothetical protein
MRKRLKTITVVAVAALALGGSAIASAAHSKPIGHKHAVTKSVKREKTGGRDTDSIQSGDQTSPDANGAKSSSGSTSETRDTGSGEETSSESDGPGGHEDPAGDVEFESEAQE